MYRIVKKPSWWTCLYDTSQPQFLYWWQDRERFEVGSYSSARKQKWEFTEEEVSQILKDYPDIENEFLIRKEK